MYCFANSVEANDGLKVKNMAIHYTPTNSRSPVFIVRTEDTLALLVEARFSGRNDNRKRKESIKEDKVFTQMKLSRLKEHPISFVFKPTK